MQLPNSIQEKLSNKSLLIAYSTGVDSVALLELITSLRDKLNLKIAIAHVNHNFREESEEEAFFAEKEAKRYKVLYHFKKLKKLPKGENKSDWSRRERYSFFKELKNEYNFDYILTAHHLNDQIETFFVKLLANKELKGIREDSEKTQILRPLINFTKEQIENFVSSKKLKFYQDQSNFETKLIRNRVRNKLIPFILEEFKDTSIETLGNSITKSFLDYELLESIALSYKIDEENYKFGSKLWLKEMKKTLLKLKSSSHLAGIEWRVVENELKDKIFYNLGRKHSERVISFLLSDNLAVDIPGDYRLRRKLGGIQLLKNEEGIN